jgi:PrtD family type I secretion system ABC transporter
MTSLSFDTTEDQPMKPFILKARKAFMYAGLFSLCINVLMLALPIYSLQVLDRVMSSRSMETLLMLTVIVIIGLVFYSVFYAIRNQVLFSVSEWLDKEVSPLLLADAVVKSSLGGYVSASQHQRDMGTIRNFITGPASTLMDAPWTFIFILVIYLINPMLGFLTVVGLIILLVFAYLNEMVTRQQLDAASKEQINSNFLADVAGRNAEAIEAMGMMENVRIAWQVHQDAASEHTLNANRRGNVIQSVSRFLRLVMQIAITGVGGYLALQNELTVGGMIASSILVGRALAPFEGAITMWKSWVGARDSYNRLNESLHSSRTLDRGTLELPRPQGVLTVENLIYTPAGAPSIIKGISFNLPAGVSVGIIGPSAAGKSTLSKLIVGLLPPTHGTVRLDGAETFKWNRANFGQYVGYMPQAVDLFTGTIKDNVARMDKNASIESVIEACKMAECHEMILRLPHGYETKVNPRMNSLSPGQRQRIGLARALYNNPVFVLLDEPNSNLDGDGERALLLAMQRMKQAGMTSIVVAHRPSVVSNVDYLLVLKGGTIERFGTPEDILKNYQRNDTLLESPKNKGELS